MTPRIAALISAQVGREFTAERFYASLDFWARKRGYRGSQDFFEAASAEEKHHGRKLLKLLQDYADLSIPIPATEEQDEQPSTLEGAFRSAFELEQEVTGFLNEIVAAADEEGEQEIEAFFSGLLRGQVKSIRELRDFLRLLQVAGGDPAAVLLVDREIGKRAG